MNPRRGEVWMVDLGLAAKVRPCLVVNVPFAGNERALYSVVQQTTSLWGTRFEVPTALRWLHDGAFDVQGVRPIPGKVFTRKLGVVAEPLMAQVEATLRLCDCGLEFEVSRGKNQKNHPARNPSRSGQQLSSSISTACFFSGWSSTTVTLPYSILK